MLPADIQRIIAGAAAWDHHGITGNVGSHASPDQNIFSFFFRLPWGGKDLWKLAGPCRRGSFTYLTAAKKYFPRRLAPTSALRHAAGNSRQIELWRMSMSVNEQLVHMFPKLA
jgi:hypothetical protein